MLATDTAPPARLLFTVEEAAHLLNLGRTYTYRLVMCRDIASIKVGRKRLIPIAALHAFVAKRCTIMQQGA